MTLVEKKKNIIVKILICLYREFVIWLLFFNFGFTILKNISMNLLIVEDNKALALELKEFLSNSGYVCKIAGTCEEALDELGSSDL